MHRNSIQMSNVQESLLCIICTLSVTRNCHCLLHLVSTKCTLSWIGRLKQLWVEFSWDWSNVELRDWSSFELSWVGRLKQDASAQLEPAALLLLLWAAAAVAWHPYTAAAAAAGQAFCQLGHKVALCLAASSPSNRCQWHLAWGTCRLFTQPLQRC